MRRNDSFKGGGQLRQAVEFYTVDDENGDSQTNSPTREKVFAYKGSASISPYQGLASRDAQVIVVGETWSTVFIRYHQGRVPIEGMFMKVITTGEFFEVKGSQPIDYDNRRVELTCRLIR